jgi:hypothetical protein
VESCKIGFDMRTRYMWITAIPLECVRHPANAYFQRRLKDRQTYFALEKNPEPTHAEFQVELRTLQDVQRVCEEDNR